jgi:hypothetical protein
VIGLVPQNDAVLTTPLSEISCAVVAESAPLAFWVGVLADADVDDDDDELELPHADSPQVIIAITMNIAAPRILFFLIWTSWSLALWMIWRPISSARRRRELTGPQSPLAFDVWAIGPLGGPVAPGPFLTDATMRAPRPARLLRGKFRIAIPRAMIVP